MSSKPELPPAEFTTLVAESDEYNIIVKIRGCNSIPYSFRFSTTELDEKRIEMMCEAHFLTKEEEQELRSLYEKNRVSRRK